MEKSNFKAGYESLRVKDQSIIRNVLIQKCKWGGASLFYMKMNGNRPISKRNEKNVDEISAIESVFRAFGINAWDGEALKFQSETI